eukprot:CFRG5929T1
MERSTNASTVFKQLADKNNKLTASRIPMFLRAAGAIPTEKDLNELAVNIREEQIDEATALKFLKDGMVQWGTAQAHADSIKSVHEGGELGRILCNIGDALNEEEILDLISNIGVVPNSTLHDLAQKLVSSSYK